MSQGLMDIVIEADAWNGIDDLVDQAGHVISQARAEHGEDVPGHPVILYTNDEALKDLNRAWRGKDRPTNVLSFPAPEGEAYPGDIAIAFETCSREAEERGIALSDHATHLVLHGFLHLLGYDHQNEDDAALMEGLEIKILKELGIADPYAAR